GLLIGPYTLPVSPVTDIHTIRLLADLGLVLLLFGLGLEFSWSKIRQIGLAVLVIGGLEIITMISLGYGLGRLLGWSATDALFLGAALHISSSAIIVKVLRDMRKLALLSSRLIVGILVVEDFAAVVIIAVLSGMASTGVAEFGDVASLVLRLVMFVAVTLALGTIIVPRIMKFASRFRSKEVFLITSLGLCFAMALLSQYLELSVAAGAFLIGSLIGDTEQSKETDEVVTPIRDMFAALFFVAIGMLIDITQFMDFIGPAVIVSAVFVTGKILSNCLATSIAGYDGKTALQVSMGMPQMGEFSLAIAKVGIDRGVVAAPLYPVVAVATAFTAFVAPYITRSADPVARFLSAKSPELLKAYLTNLSDWLRAIRLTLSQETEVAEKVKRMTKTILINLLIVVIVIGIGTFAVQSIEGLARDVRLREDIVAVSLGFLMLVLCLPSVVLIWRNLRALIDEASTYVLSRRATSRVWRREVLRAILRDSVMTAISILLFLWLMPFISRLLSIGSIALSIPLVLLAFVLLIVSRSVRDIHSQMELTFGRVLLGDEYVSTSEAAHLLGVHQTNVLRFLRKMKVPARKIGRRWRIHRTELEALAQKRHVQGEESADSARGRASTDRRQG
ncbi:MAG: cation:proton antiporter, partial [Chloroflexota bacterium]